MKTRNPFEFVRGLYQSSPWIVLSVSAHVIVLATLAVWYIARPEPAAEPEPMTVSPTHVARVVEEELPPPPPIERAKIPEMQNPVIVPENPDLVYEPKDLEEPPDVNEILGDPSADDLPYSQPIMSGAIGPGGGSNRGPGHSWSWRSGPGGRGPLGKEHQPRQIQESIFHGLRWLARHQNPDGSWGAVALRAQCSADAPCGDPKATYNSTYDTGLTGLALLAFLGAGFDHDSPDWLLDPITQQRWRAGEIVKKGLRFLKNHQNADGSFTPDRPFVYNEALATMALCEAFGMSQNRYWQESAQRGVDWLARAQRPNPSGAGLWGWRYAGRQEIDAKYPGGSLDEAGKKELFDSDTSVTGWAVMALKSAQLAGLRVEPASVDGAFDYAAWVSLPDGKAGYLDPKGAGAKVSGPDDHFLYHPATMSALSMCIRTFTRHDAEDPFLEAGARAIVADLPKAGGDALGVDYYYWYYASLALNQFDGPQSPKHSGKYWGPWNKAMVDAVTGLQERSAKTCRHGGWLVPDRWCHSGGPIYATATNVLTLEVYYRYPNAFGVRSR